MTTLTRPVEKVEKEIPMGKVEKKISIRLDYRVGESEKRIDLTSEKEIEVIKFGAERNVTYQQCRQIMRPGEWVHVSVGDIRLSFEKDEAGRLAIMPAKCNRDVLEFFRSKEPIKDGSKEYTMACMVYLTKEMAKINDLRLPEEIEGKSIELPKKIGCDSGLSRRFRKEPMLMGTTYLASYDGQRRLVENIRTIGKDYGNFMVFMPEGKEKEEPPRVHYRLLVTGQHSTLAKFNRIVIDEPAYCSGIHSDDRIPIGCVLGVVRIVAKKQELEVVLSEDFKKVARKAGVSFEEFIPKGAAAPMRV